MQRYNVITCPWFANFAANFLDFIHYQFCTLHRSPKTCIWLAERFRTFHPSLNESVTEKGKCSQEKNISLPLCERMTARRTCHNKCISPRMLRSLI